MMLGFAGAAVKEIKVILVEDGDGSAMAVRRTFFKSKIPSTPVRFEKGSDALSCFGGEAEFEPPERRAVLSDIILQRMAGIEFHNSNLVDLIPRSAVFFFLASSDDLRNISAVYLSNVSGCVLESYPASIFIEFMCVVDRYWCSIELSTFGNRGRSYG